MFTDGVKLQIRNKLDGHATDVSNSHDPSRTVVAKITVQPGAQFPWHTHPGPVLINVAQGEPPTSWPTTASTGRIQRGPPSGSRQRHGPHGNQPNDEVTVLYATFFEVPETGPLTITVEAPSDCTP